MLVKQSQTAKIDEYQQSENVSHSQIEKSTNVKESEFMKKSQIEKSTNIKESEINELEIMKDATKGIISSYFSIVSLHENGFFSITN